MLMQQCQSSESPGARLGFGCGSVVGRVGRRASLRAFAAAWEEGITVFDTARSYGFGEAEAVLGEFLVGKRDQAVIYTKYGLPDDRPSVLKRMTVPAMRAAMKAPGIAKLKRSSKRPEVKYGQFSVEGLRKSVETSLRQLRTDRVDALFLHEATVEAIHSEELLNELSRLLAAGKVLRAGVYGGREVVADALKDGSDVLKAMQFGADYFDPAVVQLARMDGGDALMVGNHPFGSEARVNRLHEALIRIGTDESTPSELREKLRRIDWPVLLEAVLAIALHGLNLDMLVFSMMNANHLQMNVRALRQNRFTRAEAALIQEDLLVQFTSGIALGKRASV